MTLTFRTLRGADVETALDPLADLRIAVFRDWPYLYDGDRAYERQYLATYRDNPETVLIGAYDRAKLVGAATGTPMLAHAEAFQAAFAGTGIDPGRVFYCAESVLLPGYRGRGAGHAFFDLREAHAKALGYAAAAFCAVNRPSDHPARPTDARSLDPFWRKRGYAPLPGVMAQFSWKDIDQSHETEKALQFWLRWF